MHSCRPSRMKTCKLPNPASPDISGSTTVCMIAQPIAASTALPPSRRTSTPASTASGCGATTMPRSMIFSLSAHAQAIGVIDRPEHNRRRPADAKDFDLDRARCLRQVRRDVGERQRFRDDVAVAARRDPPYRLAVVKHRLVADRVDAVVVDDEGDEAAPRPVLAFTQGRIAADEVALFQREETVETGFERTVDRPELAGPVGEAFFQPHRGERTRAIVPTSKPRARLDQKFVQRKLMIGAHPDFVAELSGKRDPADRCRDHPDFHAADRQERETVVRHILRNETREQLARPRSCYREADERAPQRAYGNAAVGKVALEPAHVVLLGDARSED